MDAAILAPQVRTSLRARMRRLVLGTWYLVVLVRLDTKIEELKPFCRGKVMCFYVLDFYVNSTSHARYLQLYVSQKYINTDNSIRRN